MAGFLSGLVLKKINRMAGMMPEQVVCPAARLAKCVHIGTVEKIGLHIHLLDFDIPGGDFVVYPLVRWIEAAHVTCHGDQTCLLLHEDPDNANAHNLLGTLAIEAELFEASIEFLEKAVKLSPKNPMYRNNLANSFLLSDQPEKAFPHLRRAISLNLRLSEPLMNMARACSAVGKSKEAIDQMISYFTKLFYLQRSSLGDPSERPVFIVGMPRSGTTLTEQILSSHPQVESAGELKDMEEIMRRIHSEGRHNKHYYEVLSKMKDADSRQVAGVYLATLRRYSNSALRVVDKMPHNYEALGLITMLFPNARVIYCKRDAMDNCISCFMHHFSEFHGYNSNLEKLGLYYRQHVRLMDHWKSVLPIDILESRYEDLIADQEAMSRRLIDHIGLEWDDVCLQFHEQERSVKTFSRWQVRQPIYTTSVKRWKRYDKHLEPLKLALGDQFVDG